MNKLLLGSLAILIVSVSAHAADWEIRGQTNLVSTTCGSVPPKMPIDQKLTCNFSICRVRDRVIGTLLGGYMPFTTAYLQETYPLTNGCQFTSGYEFKGFNRRNKTVRLTQIYYTQCGALSCGSTYSGVVKYR